MSLPAPPLGLLPVAWGLLAAIGGLLVGSWLGRPPPAAVIERALGPG
jgi:hypothetical protein